MTEADATGAAAPEPMLLHSLTTFRELILRCLDLVAARRIVEIGSETGALTVELAEWAAAHGAAVVSVDPEPPGRLRELAERGALEIVAGASPEALEGLAPADVYVVDGDHNHYSVSSELAHAFGDPEHLPLAILHDLGWPSGRRDMYYAPERIPEAARHPYSYHGGAIPGRAELVEGGGFRGAGSFAWAEREGGERNGVRTAVEELVDRREDLRLVVLPAVFGVGFVWSSRAPFAEALEAELGRLHEEPVLAALERNRLGLYLRTLELQDLLSHTGGRADRVIAELNERIGRLEAENAALRLGAAAAATPSAVQR